MSKILWQQILIELEFAFIQWHENAYRTICVSSGLARFFMSQSEKWDIFFF